MRQSLRKAGVCRSARLVRSRREVDEVEVSGEPGEDLQVEEEAVEPGLAAEEVSAERETAGAGLWEVVDRVPAASRLSNDVLLEIDSDRKALFGERNSQQCEHSEYSSQSSCFRVPLPGQSRFVPSFGRQPRPGDRDRLLRLKSLRPAVLWVFPEPYLPVSLRHNLQRDPGSRRTCFGKSLDWIPSSEKD